MNEPIDHRLQVTVETSPASDSWGFVGRVMIGSHEAYRTLRAYPTPREALGATQEIVGEVLGAMLAAQEWQNLSNELGRAPRRADLKLGLSRGALPAATPDDAPVEE